MSGYPSQPAPQAPNIFNVMSNWFYAPPVPGAKKRPNLRIRVTGNVPRIDVRTNVENDRENGMISFKTDMPTFATAMTMIREIASKDADCSEGCNFNYVDDFLKGKKLDRKIIQSTFQVGRCRDTGRIYMAVLSGDKSRPCIQFYFGPSDYHTMTNRDGSEMAARKVSNAYALACSESFMMLVNQMLIATFNPDAKNVAKQQVPGQGGNGGGGNRPNNYGGNGGGYQPKQQSSYGGTDVVDFDDVF